jgi:hypothetical protein
MLDLVAADVSDILGEFAVKVSRGANNIAAATEQLASYTIVDDGSSTATWPNRWEWLFDPVSGAAKLVQWVNEYGELRLTPAKDNTVALRIFGRTAPTDGAHSGPVFEIQDNRTDRNTKFGVEEDGDVTSGSISAAGTIQSTGAITRAVPSGPTLQTGYVPLATAASIPSGTPTGTPIIRS